MAFMHSGNSSEDMECTIGGMRARINVTIYTGVDMIADTLYSHHAMVT